MADLPPVAPGYVRLAILLRSETTPGAVAQACGCSGEALGHIQVDGDEAVVDVAEGEARTARESLKALGAVQLLARPKKPDLEWRWLKLAVGRNHGMTLGQFKKIMARFGVSRLGKMHLNNTHTLVGIEADRIEAVIGAMADHKINGIPCRPTAPTDIKASAAYVPKPS